jgi:hypothetical protein
MDNLRAMIDRLAQQTRERRAGEASPGAPAPAPASTEGLAFHPGDRVVELATGRRGQVIAGARGDLSRLQVFELALTTGETVYRTSTEIARDTLPISPANR